MQRMMRIAFAGVVMLLATGAIAQETPELHIYRDPGCGCCELWAEAFSRAGYATKLEERDDMPDIKMSFGVPDAMRACHTAEIEGYFVEGHVPIEAVAKLLSERPDVAGLAVPGMPSGSLGMGDDPAARYDVYAVSRNPGEAPVIFMSVGPQ